VVCRAASTRANVDMNNLKEYIAAAQVGETLLWAMYAESDAESSRVSFCVRCPQHDPSLSVSKRTSVMIRSDVRKDAEGFEDIDDFWADDDVAGDKDDTEGEDCASAYYRICFDRSTDIDGFLMVSGVVRGCVVAQRVDGLGDGSQLVGT
jgi:hypothetical protein